MKKQQIVIETREDADRALQRIGQLERHIAEAEKDAGDEIDEIRSKLVDQTAVQRFALEQNIKALKAWAKDDKKTWAAKSLDLNFGTIGFRLPPAAIKIYLAVETVIERLRARRMLTCIRVKEEVDKDVLINYAEDIIEDVGCEKTRPKDKFWYECKKEEIAR